LLCFVFICYFVIQLNRFQSDSLLNSNKTYKLQITGWFEPGTASVYLIKPLHSNIFINTNIVSLYFIWSSWIVDCMMLIFKKEFRSCAPGASVMQNLSSLLKNNFNKPEAVLFHACCTSWGFSISQLNLTFYSWCLVPVWRL